MTASEVLVESLIDWGVDTIFGLPGAALGAGMMLATGWLLSSSRRHDTKQ